MNDDTLLTINAIEDAETPPPSSPKKTNKRRFLFVLLGMIVFIILVFGGFSYWGWQIYQQTLVQIKTLVIKQNTALQERINLQTLLDQQRQNLEDDRAALDHWIKRSQNTQKETELSRADYDLQMANLKLFIERDTPMAIQFLQKANTQLKIIGNQKFDALRLLITNNINTLQTTALVSWQDLYTRLQTLKTQIASLPLITETLNQNQITPELTTKPTPQWKKALQSSWYSIQKVLVIRHDQEALEPILLTRYRTLLNLNLRLLITQAQNALLQNHTAIYEASLQETLQIIHQYYAIEETAVQKVLDELNALKSTTIESPLPDLQKLLDTFTHLRGTS